MPDEGACRLSYNRQLADRADHGSGTAHRLRTNRANENAVYVIAYRATRNHCDARSRV